MTAAKEPQPIISVITVCRNSEKTIEKTIKSVLSQTYPNIEYIIQDGKSTDNSVATAKKLCEGKDFVKIFSEPDDGVYYGMNKALEKACGEYIIFLNADDTLYNDTVLTDFSAHFDEKSGILYGDMELFNVQNGTKHIERQNNLSYAKLIAGSMYHPCMLAKKDLFTNYAKFNTKYTIAADYDWTLNIVLQNRIPIKYVPIIVSVFASGEGISTAAKNREKNMRERKDIQSRFFSKMEVIFFSTIYKTFRSLTRIKFINFLLNSYKENRINFVN